ncbi:response regulator transcription factor [Plantactinospora sp. S1510]|uniref:Response regulator transcription factor n=1 Tax=Plantactinospora alkalitolerans TaxID=2789879 RepID=A0ABS0H6Y2_9ACTN|nr:response regulator transcription factor [Plantactinospora alkalitolerans]MBF9133887.1 response regulator transcription factor [Plantactinospora alkalitolerans]
MTVTEPAGGARSTTDSTAPRILIVDDEVFLADLVASALRYAGFASVTAPSCAEAEAAVARESPDLIILDVMLPDGSGMELCQRLRRAGFLAPVIFLTARQAVEDKIAGLTVGGDDYLTKPFSLDELIARVRAVLRRARSTETARGGGLSYADLEIDEDAHLVRRHGTTIHLSPTEFNLLRYLVCNAGRVVSKQQIVDHVWEYDFGGNQGVVSTYISYLRRKIDQFDPPLIHTVPRIGYMVRLPTP